MTSIISVRTVDAREEARKSTGQFGEQHHTAPELTLSNATTYIGGDGTITCSHWTPPAAGVEWDHDMQAWDGGNGLTYAMPHVSLDLHAFGITPHQSTAFEAMVSDYACSQNELMDPDCTRIDAGGKLRLAMSLGFAPADLEPRTIERRSHELFADIDPTEYIQEIREGGIILDNDTLAASWRIDNARAIAYAAVNGRVPSDAEAAAILREFRITSTLTDGYLHPDADTIGTLSTRAPEADNLVAQEAIDLWFTTREENS